MKIKLGDARKLIAWIDEHEEMLNQFFPKLKEMTVTLPKLRGKERELVKTVLDKKDDSE